MGPRAHQRPASCWGGGQRHRRRTWTSCGPASFKKVDFVWAAQALANKVLPVPGGPYMRTPTEDDHDHDKDARPCTFWRLDANLLETIRVGHGQDDRLDELFDLFVQS